MLFLGGCTGGRFGSLFDEDPKQWGIYGDILASFGRFSLYCNCLISSWILLLHLLTILENSDSRNCDDTLSIGRKY